MAAAAAYQTFEVYGSEVWRVDRLTGERRFHDVVPPIEPYSPTNSGTGSPTPASSPIVPLRTSARVELLLKALQDLAAAPKKRKSTDFIDNEQEHMEKRQVR